MKRTFAVCLIVAWAVGFGCGKGDSQAVTPAGSPAAQKDAQQGAQPGAAPATPQAMPSEKPKPVPAELPAVVAKVNGEDIKRTDLEEAVRDAERRAGSPVPAENRDQIYRGVLDSLVGYRLLLQESRTRKIPVTDADVSAKIAEIKGQFPNEQAFTQALAGEGMTPEAMQSRIRQDLSVMKLIDAEVTPKVSVQDADVTGFYDQNRDRFKEGEAVHASHILIRVQENADAAAKKQARDKIDAILVQLKGGADFAVLAKKDSQDPGSAPNGGDLGFFVRGQMVPAFENVAFSLKPGELSNVVETPFGYHIIKVAEHRPERTVPMLEVSDRIREFLAGQQREAKTKELIDGLKTKATVEILI
ncbi:MAG: peptidylprolyl isomerase [Acidobacteriota bacterium]